MATYTNHYEMTKQQSPERVSVGLLNDNFDIIDGVMFANQEKSEQLADDYNASETYNTGDYVRRENYLYKCNTDNTTGTWDSTKWDRVKVMESVETAEDGVDNAFKTMGVMGAKNLIPYPYEEDSEVDRGITWTNYADGTVTATGTASNDSAHNLSVRTTSGKLWLKNGQYILTGTPSDGDSSTYYVEAIITKSGSAYRLGMDEGSGITITVNGDDYGNDGAYVQVRIIVKKNQAIPVGSPITFHPMLRLASDTDSTWQPYAQNNKELTENKVDWASENVLGAKNLVPYPTRALEGTAVINSVTFNIGSDGIISTNGTASADTTLTMFARVTDKNNLKAGTYSFSCSPSDSGGSATTFFSFYGLHNGTNWDVLINDYGEGGVFKVTEEMENDGLALNIQIKSGTNVDGLHFKPFVCPACVRDRSYTPYAMTNKNLTDIVKCKQITAGTYILQATVDSNKVVTYAWVPTT